MKSNSNSERSPMEKLVTQKFALLARVGQQKRKALEFQEEGEFYFTTATEALAIVAELLVFMQGVPSKEPTFLKFVSELTSRQHQLIRNILHYWPKNTESQERLFSLLDSDGVLRLMEQTPGGYSSLSSDLVTRNVGRILEASRASIPKA